jgi:hypothetical protein
MNLVNALILKAIAISPFIQDAKRRHRAWEAAFDAVPPAAPLGRTEADPAGTLRGSSPPLRSGSGLD